MLRVCAWVAGGESHACLQAHRCDLTLKTLTAWGLVENQEGDPSLRCGVLRHSPSHPRPQTTLPSSFPKDPPYPVRPGIPRIYTFFSAFQSAPLFIPIFDSHSHTCVKEQAQRAEVTSRVTDTVTAPEVSWLRLLPSYSPLCSRSEPLTGNSDLVTLASNSAGTVPLPVPHGPCSP